MSADNSMDSAPPLPDWQRELYQRAAELNCVDVLLDLATMTEADQRATLRMLRRVADQLRKVESGASQP